MSFLKERSIKEIRELTNTKEKAKIVSDALRMEAWLEVKKLLEGDAQEVEIIVGIARFLEASVVAYVAADDEMMVKVYDNLKEVAVQHAKGFREFLFKKGLDYLSEEET